MSAAVSQTGKDLTEPAAQILRPHPQVVARRVGDEVVLVQLDRNSIHALNQTGARFWELLADGRSRAECCEQMLEEFDVSRAELDREIDELLGQLFREGLLADRQGMTALQTDPGPAAYGSASWLASYGPKPLAGVQASLVGSGDGFAKAVPKRTAWQPARGLGRPTLQRRLLRPARYALDCKRRRCRS